MFPEFDMFKGKHYEVVKYILGEDGYCYGEVNWSDGAKAIMVPFVGAYIFLEFNEDMICTGKSVRELA